MCNLCNLCKGLANLSWVTAVPLSFFQHSDPHSAREKCAHNCAGRSSGTHKGCFPHTYLPKILRV